ncbi:hypothetical protein [Bosea sp. PAMC 26642]|uniref:hypothetical protein n=1 Tax=Bosea sp. (strain PAMC 26642) TaxID=1792307 RepID=UPI0007706151|nr:hypothetical protein [Bosea sp. PAMC 26642]AMJ59374.1 hypothetical protein AXW83_02805 [Bosea sp. PAMC 26642]
MRTISDRLAKLEAVTAALRPPRGVERHIIAEGTDADRKARIKAILEASSSNVLHVFRVIVKPGEAGATVQ